MWKKELRAVVAPPTRNYFTGEDIATLLKLSKFMRAEFPSIFYLLKCDGMLTRFLIVNKNHFIEFALLDSIKESSQIVPTGPPFESS